MKRNRRLFIAVVVLAVANVVLFKTEALRAEPQQQCYHKLCQVNEGYPFWSYCYGWPFGQCAGVGNCCASG